MVRGSFGEQCRYKHGKRVYEADALVREIKNAKAGDNLTAKWKSEEWKLVLVSGAKCPYLWVKLP